MAGTPDFTVGDAGGTPDASVGDEQFLTEAEAHERYADIRHASRHSAGGLDSLSGYAREFMSPVRKLVSGRYYRGAHVITTGAPGQNVLNLIPFRVPHNATLDRLAVQVTTGAGSAVVRLGIYTSDANDFPATRLLDAGTVDATATAVVEATISQSVSAGLIWLAAVAQGGSPTLRCMNVADPLIAVTTAALALGSTINGYFQSGVSGALPATLSLSGPNGTCPLVAVRVA